MTLVIDEIYLEIDYLMTEKYGEIWIEIIGADKYFEIRTEYEKLSKEDKVSFSV